MVKKIITILAYIFVVILLFGIYINWYISEPREYDDKICIKNKLLTKWEDDEAPVYTRIKGLRCEMEGDILIIEDIDK